ncbi:hypothetical protein H5410_004680 [Solanum commersonii]|uniref:Uncharacterized protein n=1 Tax=Solanum commersonii TaxID=4109 RepID=A0A9J6B8N8_SOLCO|nr:hypothetical protein H5410_004680 [Solanum commersonii]
MTVRCCYCGIYVELKTSRTPTNPRKNVLGLPKIFIPEWVWILPMNDANDSTCQEQYNTKNPSTSSGKEDKEDKEDIKT